MTLPFFYINEYDPLQNEIELDEDTSRHIVQVLRMKEGERLNLTDGKGSLMEAEIRSAHKKHCSVKVIKTQLTTHYSHKVTIAISLLKNTNRFEWFLEKATEIGVTGIIPLICERTEKQKFRYERMKGICISAMLQSQQTWLPSLHEPRQFKQFVVDEFDNTQKLIAHCVETNKQAIKDLQIITLAHWLILIGPEGDFTRHEIDLALQYGFIPVDLGGTRLRSETAGVVASAILVNK